MIKNRIITDKNLDVFNSYSKLWGDFFLNRFTNLEIAISIGHISHTVEECLIRCFSNDFLESNTISHLVQ